MCQQRLNVILSFPQRRNMDVQGIEPVHQVQPEFFLLDPVEQVVVGGRYDTEVCLDNARVTNPGNDLFFRGSKNLGLKRKWHIRNFIQKQRSVVAHFKESHFI